MSNVDLPKLRVLCHTAIDYGSPIPLRLQSDKYTLALIGNYTFAQLDMLPDGIALMWRTYNAHATKEAGAKPVPAAAMKKPQSVKEFWDAVCAASKLNPVPSMSGDYLFGGPY